MDNPRIEKGVKELTQYFIDKGYSVAESMLIMTTLQAVAFTSIVELNLANIIENKGI